MTRLLNALLIAALLGGFADAQAQSWPTRPIRVIVSFPAGSAPDIVCRFVTERLSRAVGQQIIVDNRPGSGNIIAGQAAARSAPDGYNFFCATAATLVSNPHTFKSLPYDPARDFVPVGMMAAWLNKIAGTGILTVPYATMPLGIQDTLAGRTQLVILAVPAAAPRIRSGELRPLAASFAKRVPGYENVPAISETFPGFELVGWFLIVAPGGTPNEIVLRVNREMDRILKDPETAQRLRALGFFTEGAETPEAVAEAIRVHMLEEGVFKASTNKTVFTGFGANPMPAPRPGAVQLMHRMFDQKLEIEDMDARGIDVSVVTSSAVVQGTSWADPQTDLDLCKRCNDKAAEWAAQYPDRIVGSFVLPLQDVKRSLQELERAVTKLKLKVANIGAQYGGAYMGDPVFHPFWEAIQAHEVTVWIHPEGTRDPWFQRYALWNSAGQSIEEAKCLTSLVYEGVMYKYPKLKVVIAHGGGYFPHYLGRMDRNTLNRPDTVKNIGGRNPR